MIAARLISPGLFQIVAAQRYRQISAGHPPILREEP